MSDADKLCEEALALIGNVNDIFSLPPPEYKRYRMSQKELPELIKSDQRYRMTQKDVSNCSSSQISEESETVRPYCSSDDEQDFQMDKVDDKDDEDYVLEPISDVSDEELEKVKGSPQRKGIENTGLDLEKGKNVHLCANDGTNLLEELLQR